MLLAVLAGCSSPQQISDNFNQVLLEPVVVEQPNYEPEIASPYQQHSIPKALRKKITIQANARKKPNFVFYEIENETGFPLVYPQSLEGLVTCNFNEAPAIDILNRITGELGLHYEVYQGLIRIFDKNELFHKDYSLPLLNQTRQSTSNLSLDTKFITAPNSLSNISLKEEQKGNLWDLVKGYLEYLKGYDFSIHDPQPQGGIIIDEDDEEEDWPKAPIVPRGTLPKQKLRYSINPQAGMISVYANGLIHDQVNNYLRQLHQMMTSQVLIEAKVIEVELKEEHRSGIDWHLIASSPRMMVSAPLDGISQLQGVPSSKHGMIQIAATSNNLAILLNFIERFGRSRTISSPRLTVTHNQTAVLKVVRNEVYFEVHHDFNSYEPAGRSRILPYNNTHYHSEVKTIPVGFIMTVQPAINPRTRQVMLSLRPSLSRVVDYVQDPGVALAKANSLRDIKINSSIPVIEEQEFSTVINILDPDSITILGGLMEEHDHDSNTGIPGLKKIPFLGKAFQATARHRKNVELIILLKVKLLNLPKLPPPANRRISLA